METQIRLLSVEGQPTKTVLAQTCVGVIFIHSMYGTSFALFCFPSKTGFGSLFEKHCT
jgi:hypothetical protein